MKTQENSSYNVEDHFEEYNITRISTIEEIDEIYDYEMMIKTNVFSARNSEKISVILFDSPVQARNFLVESFTEFVDEFGEVAPHISIFYCDDKIVYDTLFKKYFMLNDIDCKDDCGIPVILVANGIDDEIIFEMETFAPISVKTFENIFEELS